MDQEKLLYVIPNVKAYHIEEGEESDLCPSGRQPLSIYTIPLHGQDLCLHLSLPPELEISLPATTQIFHQHPTSYLIPLWGITGQDGAFTRIEFSPKGKGVEQEDIDTFETILAQFTAFLENAPAPKSGKGEKAYAAYNPSSYKPGEAYVAGTGKGEHGRVVLVNEDNGSVVGEVAKHDALVDDSLVTPGQKDPVEIYISEDGKTVQVKPVSEDYLALARHPAYADSSIVQNAAAASRLIVTTSDYIANLLSSSATNLNAKTKPQKPITFSQTTHEHVRKINRMTTSVAGLSSKTVGSATKIAQNIGASLTRRGKAKTKEEKLDAKGSEYKPGILNKSMIAFSTIADGVSTGGKHLLTTGGAATTAVVEHRYGKDAGKVAKELTSSVTNVGLVYIDVTGVSRRAVIKSVAKGMIVGRVAGGATVVVGEGDGGNLPASVYTDEKILAESSSAQRDHGSSAAGASGNPPAYTPGDYKPSEQPEKYT